ncbi:ABC transporter related protein [Leadbetterella byssophila DSM 17132]|uniref:ABC transporter related protein n=1 Tax=Leadbetterella byssophila (strain DSM 17132 / JCM 16389 / KACC 11308 / NBRC 106382 / 4M15) TaxID=649349 RepID=E4RQC3_LEAB4|nr:ABC transporter ATP-binding protein [Leadbetterella byssophila]ADQ18331.1 ABC transporter related protein [Leadbetterella byssophila DSM 17132]
MKIYLRILGFAGSLKNFLVPFAIFSLIAGVFGVLNLALLKPLLDVLFEQVSPEKLQTILATEPKWYNIIGHFYKGFAQNALENGKLATLKFVVFAVILASLINNLAKYLSVRVLEKFKTNMIANLRNRVFEHTMGLHLGFFTNERKGELMSRITGDVQEVENSIASSFSAVIKESISLVSFIVALVAISWELSLFALLLVPVISGFLAYMIKKLRTNATDSQQRLSNIVTVMDEAFGSMRVVKAFRAERFVSGKFAHENDQYRKAVYGYSKKRELASPFSEFSGVTAVAGLLYFGGALILNQSSDLQASDFITFIALFSQITRPAKDISNAFGQAQRGIVAGGRILELLDKDVEIPDGQMEMKFEKEIEFDHVNFSYTTDRPILKDISFTLNKGETVALVGASGGGKSTIADLLIRFYDVSSGKIKIDGVDIRDLSQSSLRSQMGVVTQEPMLFNDTIANNIAFGRVVSEEEIIRAAKIANAHDFIMAQPEGYQTSVGDRGSRLSGGQKQRISIARAIVQNPPILILDEATSALDTESEKLVQEALTELMKNRTTLVVAHRLSTIQNANKILVINEGKIVEAGTHEELVALNQGYYRKLASLQEL